MCIQGHLAHTKLTPPYDHRRALGIGPLQGPRRKTFLMSEVPLSLTKPSCEGCPGAVLPSPGQGILRESVPETQRTVDVLCPDSL